MYCGNNNFERRGRPLGSRYQCFKKGVGIGMRMPREDFEPIERNPKIYCGESNRKPPGYDYIGTRSQCLQKGVGVGKTI